MFAKLGTPGEPFDIAWYGFGWPFADPSFPQLFAQHLAFHSPDVQPTPRAGIAAAGRDPSATAPTDELDVDLARNAASGGPYSYDNALTFVSERTGCVVANPYLDLAAVCLK